MVGIDDLSRSVRAMTEAAEQLTAAQRINNVVVENMLDRLDRIERQLEWLIKNSTSK